MSKKEDNIDKVIPDELREHLFEGRWMSIGKDIYKATAKVEGLKGNRRYFLDFLNIPKADVADMIGKKNVIKILKEFNYDYEFPIPCNIKGDYEYVVDGIIWNSYKTPLWEEKEVTNEKDLRRLCPRTIQLYEHIYKDSLIMGLDYATVEFMNPTQPLPVQVLYSRVNNTGKSTMLLHRRAIYGKNGNIIDSRTFTDGFNTPIVGMNFIGIDEGKLHGEEGIEKIKLLVTSPVIQHRAMRKSSVEVPNFSKWFIATNREQFGKLDRMDSRFWVMEIGQIEHSFDPDFLEKLKSEIPAWIGFLKYRWDNRKSNGNPFMFMETKKAVSRLWFSEKQYETKQLMRVKNASVSHKAQTFIEVFMNWVDEMESIHPDKFDKFNIYGNASQIMSYFVNQLKNIDVSNLRYILEHELCLPVIASKRYRNFFKVSDFTWDTRKNVFHIDYRKIADFANIQLPEEPKQTKIWNQNN